MLNIKILGENIRFYRKAQNMTQNELANSLNVSFQAVSNWERGAAPPDLDNIIKLSELFNITIDKLLKQQAQYERIFIGIDGGATKTEFAMFTLSGRVLKNFKLPGSNPNDIGFEAAFGILVQGIDMCLAEHPDIACVFAGMSGLGVGENRSYMAELLHQRYKNIKFELDNDAVNVLSSGNDNTEYAMICGTGSILYKKLAKGYKRFGGYGYLFDKAGSGYDLGRDALITSFLYEDGMAEYSAIYPLVCKQLGKKAMDAQGEVYKKGKAYIASFAPLVFEAYKQNDAAAVKIVNETVCHLADIINKACEGKPAHVIACGGIIEHFSDILVPKIVAKCPKGTEIEIPKLPPVYGACRECLRRFNITADAHFYDKFLEEYYKNA